MLPMVTTDIGYSLSEIYSQLKQESKNKWKKRFTSLANQKQWPDPNSIEGGIFPKLTRNLLPLFYRLRTMAIRTDHVPYNCICGLLLQFDHIFQCEQLLTYFRSTQNLLLKDNKQFGISVLSLEMTEWNTLETFLRELFCSPIGHVI